MIEKKTVTAEDIDQFMNGRDPMERIVNLEYSYRDDFMRVYYRDENDNKHIKQEGFYPFLWATRAACRKLCDGNKSEIRRHLLGYGISCTGLDTTNTKGEVVKEMENGYTVMFRAMRPMSYSKFLDFFKKCGNPVYSEKKVKSGPDTFMNQTPEEKEHTRQYLVVTPKEQYLISTGKRFFKGYDDYNCCLRMIFDLETTGLDTRKDRIEQFGIWFNRPVKYRGKEMEFHKIYDVSGESKEELDESELKNIRNFLKIIYTFRPDIITAHNGESFDWNIIIGACERLGTSLENESRPYFDGETIRKDQKETILKLGGEIEKFNKTIVPGCIVTDSLHAVRRAQALDSNMQEANLKYVTKYAGLEKPDRVYVPGDKISAIYNDYEEKYAFNDEDGDWYVYNPDYEITNTEEKRGKDTLPFTLYTKNKINEGYHLVTGHYIVQRYLLDDLYECDKVEYNYNTTNFFICKMLPIPFEKCCTMGTAGQWKGLMLAWSYERNLAIPMFGVTKPFTGGLSRLLRTGYVKQEVKFDYNSLYPSITLTWGVSTWKDLDGVMLKMLEYVLTKREEYKGMKKKANKIVESYEERLNNGEVLSEEDKVKYEQAQSDYAFNDFKQMQQKCLANSFFGSYGNQSLFNWGDLNCAERITCTGRQSLRLMISYFNNLGYKPVVGDSFTGDTPLYIKYDESGMIDIVPISKLIDEKSVEKDVLGREYDYSKKPYKVLCRSGWVEPSYIYRHKTDKKIYRVTDDDRGMMIDVTEDHSLFDESQNKVSPKEIDNQTKLEYYNEEINGNSSIKWNDDLVERLAINMAKGIIDKVPMEILNANKKVMKLFYNTFMANYKDSVNYNKTCLAGLGYVKNCISK